MTVPDPQSGQSSAQQPFAQQPVQQPAPIPTRILQLDLKKPPMSGYLWLKPTVAIGGYTLRCEWGPQQFTVPRDQPIEIAAWVEYLFPMGRANAVLYPQHAPALEYMAPAYSYFGGSMAAPGHARVNGRGMQLGLLCVAGGILLGAIALLATMFIALAI